MQHASVVQRAVTPDGTEIVGEVHGSGPPVVLVHGAVADGASEWGALLPHLTERFTCYLPSTRGRGGSGDHPDHSREARVQDVVAFVESIGQPVALVGVSGGGMLALGAAARSTAVSAVVAMEPVAYEVLDEELATRFRAAVDHMEQAAADGRATEAADPFLGLIANAEEAVVLADDPDGIDDIVAYLPVDIAEFREADVFAGPSPTASETLARIAVPTLLLRGAETALDWFTDSVRYVADHVPDSTVRDVPGVGHFGHLIDPARSAQEIVPFLEQARRPV